MAQLNKNPNTPVLSFFKDYMTKGVNGKVEFLMLKADLEIYIGIYIVVGWFFGLSSLISIFFFWQFMRLKYMLNYNTKQAFGKLRLTVDGWLSSPSIPSIVNSLWTKVKQLCEYMVDFEQPQGGAGRPSM